MIKDLNDAHLQGRNVKELVEELRAQAVPAATFLRSQQGSPQGGSLTVEDQLRLTIRVLEWKIKALLNPHFRPEAPIILAVLEETQRLTKLGKTDPDGWCFVPYIRIAKRLDIGQNTVGRHINRAAEAGLIEKENRREFISSVNRKTGEIIERQPINKSFFRLTMSLLDHFALVAEYVPGKKRGWGGRRVRCPQHPDANIIRGTFCAECGELLRAVELDEEGNSEQIFP